MVIGDVLRTSATDEDMLCTALTYPMSTMGDYKIMLATQVNTSKFLELLPCIRAKAISRPKISSAWQMMGKGECTNHTKVFQIVKLSNYALDISITIAIGVAEPVSR